MELPDTTALDTLPKLLAHNAANWPDDIALREKDYGIWNTITWADYNARTRAFACAMHTLGLGKGDVVALIGDNRPDWVMGEIAAHAVGAMSLGMYRDALDEEVAYLVNHAGAKLVMAEDEEQADKILRLAEKVPSVKHIVYSDPRGMRKYDDPRLISVDDFTAMGEAALAADAGLYDRLVAEGDGDAVAVLCTTSGTTANPKLAMLTGGALIRHCAAYLAVDPKGPDDEYVSVLPLPWIMEQIYALGWAQLTRMKVNFVEATETHMHDMREIGPTFLVLAPRVWESIVADVRSRMMDASRIKNKLFDLGTELGLKALDEGKRNWFADLTVLKPLSDRLGFGKLRSAATGGAAMGPDTFRFFNAMGVPLRQLYGQTELMGAYTIHTDGDVDYDTVGVPLNDEVEVTIENADSNGVGEIITRHPNMFAGYYGNEEATREELRDGRMHTGDAGFFNDRGHLVVIDRTKDLATTSAGDRFSPQFIENKLKFSPFIAEAVVLGNERPYLSAIICIRYSIVSKWAEKERIAFTTYSDLSGRDRVYQQVRREVEQVNASMPEAQRIRKFLLLYKELDADDGELTRTRKVRRGVVGEKYADIIGALYTDATDIPVDTEIAFQDGSKQRIRTSLKVVDLAPGAGETRAAAE